MSHLKKCRSNKARWKSAKVNDAPGRRDLNEMEFGRSQKSACHSFSEVSFADKARGSGFRVTLTRLPMVTRKVGGAFWALGRCIPTRNDALGLWQWACSFDVV